jgi:pentatricopeptide repeat protein
LFYKNDGTEIDRICGYDGDENSYYQTVADYVDGKNTLGDLHERLNQSPQDIQANYRLAKKYIARWEMGEAQPYFKHILELDPRDTHGYNEECRGYIAVYTLNTTENDQPLLEWLDQASNEEYLERGYNALVRFYSRHEMPDKAMAIYEQMIKRLPENADLMNGYAWYIYQQKSKEHYGRGIELAQQALKLKPQAAHIWDTLSWLEFENGQLEQAIEHMKKAVELAPQQPGFMENLKKMEEAKK